MRWAVPTVVAAAIAVGATMAATGSTSKRGTVDVHKTGTFGTVLVAANGRTLYRYTVDSKGVNRCSAVAACNGYWPALLVKQGVKPTAGPGVSTRLLGTIAAAHGMRQVTYAGFPLYFFSGDKRTGQTNGQEFGEKWYLVGAGGALVEHAVKPAPSTTPSSSGGGY